MNFIKRFSSLRWKLVFSYVIVTLLTVLILEGIIILASGWLDLRLAAEWDNRSASGLSPGDLGTMLLTTTIVLLPCMIPLGMFFGFVSTTGFIRRLSSLSITSNALAKGDFSRRVHDTSGDEIGQLARQFNAMADQLENDTNRLRELVDHNARLAAQAQLGAAIEERHRLARDLHDGVKQHLFGMNLATSAVLNLLESDPEAARTKLLEAKDLSRQAQTEIQALLNELRPAGLDEHGLVDAITGHLVTVKQREEIEVVWQPVENLNLPLIHEQALFRVFQEALTNVSRHAKATQVTVELHITPDTITLCITDNGKGFDPTTIQTRTTMGLKGMQERLAGLGGKLTIDTAPGTGTRIMAQLPRFKIVEEGESYA
ncbi:MAG: sensor histidine kinase [Anaerolineales bacterium]|nr:sensor histidine kinase [Anaerolineales bacterium]